MLHFIIIYLTTTLFIIAGGMSAVSEEDEKQITTDSDLIFEAIFVEKQIQHYLDGKKIDSIDLNNLDGKYNDLIDGISVRRKITLLITKPIKGNLKKHQLYNIEIEDPIFSMCPHIADLGFYQAKQIYYITTKESKTYYRYRTIKKKVYNWNIDELITIDGTLGSSIGTKMTVSAIYKPYDGDPFGETNKGEDYAITINKGRDQISMNLKLHPKYKEAGGKLVTTDQPTTYEGYESLEIAP